MLNGLRVHGGKEWERGAGGEPVQDEEQSLSSQRRRPSSGKAETDADTGAARVALGASPRLSQGCPGTSP